MLITELHSFVHFISGRSSALNSYKRKKIKTSTVLRVSCVHGGSLPGTFLCLSISLNEHSLVSEIFKRL